MLPNQFVQMGRLSTASHRRAGPPKPGRITNRGCPTSNESAAGNRDPDRAGKRRGGGARRPRRGPDRRARRTGEEPGVARAQRAGGQRNGRSRSRLPRLSPGLAAVRTGGPLGTPPTDRIGPLRSCTRWWPRAERPRTCRCCRAAR